MTGVFGFVSYVIKGHNKCVHLYSIYKGTLDIYFDVDNSLYTNIAETVSPSPGSTIITR